MYRHSFCMFYKFERNIFYFMHICIVKFAVNENDLNFLTFGPIYEDIGAKNRLFIHITSL